MKTKWVRFKRVTTTTSKESEQVMPQIILRIRTIILMGIRIATGTGIRMIIAMIIIITPIRTMITLWGRALYQASVRAIC